MNTDIQALSILDIDDTRWFEFVESCPDATAFHHPAWVRLIAQCYQYQAFALARFDTHGRIIAGIPVIEVSSPLRRRRWVSLPFTDRCPPLVRSETVRTGLVEELDVARRQAGVSQLEVRDHLAGTSAHASPVAVGHDLRLDPDPELVYRRFKRLSVRKGITRAERYGVVIREGESRLALTDVFYRLHLQTRRRLGVPAQPRRYFDLLWRQMIEPGRGFVLLAYNDRTPIAGAVFLAWNGTVIYKYGASDSRYWDLHPNHLVMWTAIRWGCEHGFDAFDFGRSELGNKGLRQFKSGWATEHSLMYTTITDRPVPPLEHRLQDAAGTVIRHCPLWVCRVAGELLYRYAA
jgi:CelD/BcsL family acetyltransferase involved in cellulose biosynthesis